MQKHLHLSECKHLYVHFSSLPNLLITAFSPQFRWQDRRATRCLQSLNDKLCLVSSLHYEAMSTYPSNFLIRVLALMTSLWAPTGNRDPTACLFRGAALPFGWQQWAYLATPTVRRLAALGTSPSQLRCSEPASES